MLLVNDRRDRGEERWNGGTTCWLGGAEDQGVYF